MSTEGDDMISYKKEVDPTVNHLLLQIFPEEFIRENARETGAFKRERKIDSVTLFWVFVLGYGVDFLRSIRSLNRKYEAESGTKISISSFYARFTPEMITFFRQCVIHAIKFQAQEPSCALGEKLNGFKDIVIQDSLIIRLHEFLSDKWPAARSRKAAAGVKVSCVVSAVANGPKSIEIFPERVAEIKTLKIGPWIKNRILLIDLGFFKYGIFNKIDKYNGYFISRLKSNANPTIVKLNNHARNIRFRLKARR